MASDFSIGIGLSLIGGAAAKSILGGVDATIGKIGTTTSKLEAKQVQLGASIKKYMGTLAPASLRSLNNDYNRLGRSIDKLKRKELALHTAIAKRDHIRTNRDRLHGRVIETVAIGATVAAPIKLAIDHEAALSDLKKVTDFSKDEFNLLSGDLMNLTREIPVSMEGLTAIGAAAGRMGVSTRQEILQYAKETAKIAIAFDMSEDDAGTRMAELARAMDKPIAQAGKLAGKINLIGNTAGLTESQLIDGMTRFGPVASSIKNLTDDMAFSMATVLIESGRDAEVGARALNSITTRLSSAHVGTNRLKKGLQSLRIDPEAIADMMQHDADSAIKLVLTRMQGLQEKDQIGLGKMMFGEDFGDEVLSLIQKTGRIDEFNSLLKKTDSEGRLLSETSIDKEFTERLSTTKAQLGLLKNSFVEIGSIIGSTLLPAINDIVADVKPVLHSTAEWIKENKGLVGAIAKGIVVLGALKIGLFVGAYGLNLMAGSVNALSIGFNLLSGKATLARTLLQMKRVNGKNLLKLGSAVKWLTPVLGSLSTGFAVLGTAIMATPIGWIVAGVAAIVGAGIAIYKYWQPIKALMGGIWDGFATTLSPVTSVLKPLAPIGNAIGNVFSWVGEKLGILVGWFGSLFTPITMAKEELEGFTSIGKTIGTIIGNVIGAPFTLSKAFFNIGKNIITGLINGITNMSGMAIEKIGSIASSIKAKFTGWLGINSPSRVFMGYGTNIGQGLTLGMQNQIGDVVNANQRLGLAAANDETYQNTIVSLASRRHAIPARQLPDLPSDQQINQALNSQNASMTIHFSPTIQVNGNAQVQEQVQQGLDVAYREFERNMRRFNADTHRRKLA